MPRAPRLTNLDGILAPDEIHIWHTSLELPQESINALSTLLDASEQARSAKFLVSDARKQFVISHGFLRTVLARYLQIEPNAIQFSSGRHGKPELVGSPGLRFNLSHTEGTAAMAVTRANRVGIDVEKVRDNLNPLELAGRFFSAKECEWLRSQFASDRLKAFFSCWTAKEAYIKACGGGLSLGLDGFSVIPRLGEDLLQLEIHGQPGKSGNWLIWQLNLKADTCAAVAAEAEELSLRVGEWFPPL